MRDSTSLVTEVRIKLHIKLSNEPEVKNLWMCLNYDEKPTVFHVVEHVKKSFCADKKNQDKQVTECKLFLDNYWLPPHENSRLIRENDCIRVEVVLEEAENLSKPNQEKMKTLNQNVLDHLKSVEQRISEKQQQMEKSEFGRTAKALSAEEIATVEAATKAATNADYYNHFYDRKAYYGDNTNETSYNCWLNNDYFNRQTVEQTGRNETWNDSKPLKPQNKQPQQVLAKSSKLEAKTIKQQQQQHQQPSKNVVKSPKEVTNCYKKFAIGSYAHLLNEAVQAPEKNSKKNKSQKKQNEDKNESDNLSEEQVIDSYYQALQLKKPKNQKANENCADLEKISANVSSTGRQKWKNSTQQTKSNGPKHIIFRTSSSESSTDSSSDSESEQAKPTTIPTKKPVAKVNKFYEPSKEEQVNSVSYNRSYYIENTKNLIDFKKIFNEEKLNAPQAEEFADRSEYPKKGAKKSVKNSEKYSSSADSQNTSVNTENDGDKSRKQRQRSPPAPKVNYDKFQSLVGAPRINDKIAFQILEISSNFTPEVSDYKTGTVVEFDQATNEITLELNNKYNQVLKRPSKFSVILDETDKENVDQEEEPQEEISQKQRRNSSEQDNMLKVDWRNLMNLKLCPDEAELAKQQQFAELQQQPNLHV